MEVAIQRILPKFARCKTMYDVGALGIDGARQVFGGHVACMIFVDEHLKIRERVISGLRETDFEEWDRDWRELDKVFPVAAARAMPVHRGQFYRDDEWHSLIEIKSYGRRLGIEHYLAAPLFGSRGNLAGMLTVCRPPRSRTYDGRALALASMFSGFLSATLARVSESNEWVGDMPYRLSPRELQVARLAAGGRNNLEIALQLGLARETVKQTLRRVYTKLQVNGRAPMAAKLAAALQS
jgi:DNA-binding CsgD family transcriptional regulator